MLVFHQLHSLRELKDSECKILLTADGSFRGSKVIDLKSIVDEALLECDSIESTIVFKRTGGNVKMNNNETWWHNEIEDVSGYCEAEEMDSEDMLFYFIHLWLHW